MKIETFVKGVLVIMAMFTLGLVLVGDSILQQKYSVSNAPQFATVDALQQDMQDVQSKIENETLQRSDDTGQGDIDLGDDSWSTYTRRSLKATTQTFSTAVKSRSSIASVLTYLRVNPMIIVFIASFIIVSIGFALVTWWKNRRP